MANALASRRVRWLLGIVLPVLVILVVWRDSISERLVPDPRLNQRIEQAQLALREGRLSSPDGSGARELFESVLATDPDQMLARQGLVQVRQAATGRAREALDARRLSEASRYLELARALSAPIADLEALHTRLRALEQATGDIPVLLAEAAVPGLDEEQAHVLADRILRLDAENPDALQRRREIHSDWMRRAESLLDSGRVREAKELVDHVIAADPGHLDLPPVQARLGEALAQAQQGQARLIRRAREDERAGRLERAAEAYLRLSSGVAAPPSVAQALERLALGKAAQARHEAADFRFRQAEASLALARRWSPGSEGVNAAAAAIRQSRLAGDRLLRTPGKSQQQRVPGLIAEAEEALARGELTTPPGTSAWDKLRVAAAISPAAPSVVAFHGQFRQRAHACFQKALADSQLSRAQSCLEASQAADPVSERTRQRMETLAGRWLAYAEERIRAGDYDEAEKAIASARRWQPSNPQVDSISARLRQARGTR